jgi:tetratricopeptide (TPR) repeat protein
LLIFKGNNFTKNQIRSLIGEELENQDYEDFKLKVIPNESNDFDNYVINFIEEFGDNYIEYIGFFSELLIEKGFSIPDDEIESKIEEIKKHSELIDLEDSILNFDENSLEVSNKNKFNPEESKIWFNKGNIYYDIDNFDEAIWCYDNALELDPSNILALNMKGLVLHKLGKINAVAACYNKALHISSNNPETWNNMGILLFDIKQKEKAAICYNIASKVDNDAKTFSNLNKSLKILGKAPGIISKYQSFMETSTLDPSVLFESIDPSTIVDADPSDTIDSLSQLFQ